MPFEWNTSYRIVVKDNHAPCIETPIDESGFIPPAGREPIIPTTEDGHWTNKGNCSATPVSYVGDSYSVLSTSCAGI